MKSLFSLFLTLLIVAPLRGDDALVPAGLMRKDAIVESECPYELSLFTVFQQEAPYLREWIEYHKIVGVEHFYLFNNNSEDAYLEVLEPYIESGEVELYDWPTPADEPGFRQVEALQEALRLTRGQTRWLANIDVDEFICPLSTDHLLDFLADYEDKAQVFIHWHFYGTSFVEKIPEDRLLIETLTLSAPLEPGKETNGKVIIKPHRIYQANVHACTPFNCFSGVDTNPGCLSTKPPIKLNHYWTRDADFLLNVKRPRRERYEGKPWSEELVASILRNQNIIEDGSMDRFIPTLRDLLFPEEPSENPEGE